MSRKNVLACPAVSRRRFLGGAGALAGATALAGLGGRAAHASGSLVWYTGTGLEATDDLMRRFSERTGATTEYWRGGGLRVAQRVEQEMQAGQNRADVTTVAVPVLMLKWVEEGMIMEYDSPEYAHFSEDVIIPGYAAPSTAEPMTMAYNTEIISADEAPKTWEEVLDPKWRGRITMSDAASSGGALHWYSAMRETYGLEFMEELAQQQPLIRTGGGDVVNTLISGERPLAVMLPQYHALRAIGADGAPLRIIVPDEGVPMNLSMTGILNTAPNADNARKFQDFVLSAEEQAFVAQEHYIQSLHDEAPPLSSEWGARPLDEIRLIASSWDDYNRFFELQEEMTEEWLTMFR